MSTFYCVMAVIWFICFLWGAKLVVALVASAAVVPQLVIIGVVVSPLLCAWNINKAIRRL